jgi:DNA primase
VRLLDVTLIRVGNEEYARENGSFGLTTLRNRHVANEGTTLRFRFKGTSGVSHDVELSVATLPDGLDPYDLLVRQGGVDTFKKVLTSATDALDFKLNRLLERETNPSVEVTRRIIDEILTIIAATPPLPSKASQMKRELMVTRLAHRLGVRQETVWARLSELQRERRATERKEQQYGPKAMPAAARTTQPADAPAEKSGPAVTLERQLIQLVLNDMSLIPEAAKAISPDQITHPGLRRLLGDLYALQAATGSPDMEQLRERLRDKPELYDYAETRLRVAGQSMGKEPAERLEWLGRIVNGFARMKSEAEQRSVREQLKAAPEGDEAVELLRKLQAAHKKKREGDAA